MSGIAWKIYQNSLFQIPSQIKNDCIFAFIRIMYCLNNIDPIFLVLYRKTSKFLQPEHWILEHWTIQNLFTDWLISPKICRCSTSKLKKIFSAICWRPGFFKIFSNMLQIKTKSSFLFLLWIVSQYDMKWVSA